jgi:hypothetical protein
MILLHILYTQEEEHTAATHQEEDKLRFTLPGICCVLNADHIEKYRLIHQLIKPNSAERQ